MISFKKTELQAWLRAQHNPDTPFVQFMQEVGKLYEQAREAALIAGETEFQKGEAEGLRTILALPEAILKAGDTEETPAEKDE